ncbi:MAG: hypothetical protein WC765_06510 [Phycisphaerae bacterium]|jgi:hypothetical protein
MHLVKWIRKNMSKLMAVFVILIMVAFIMPQVLNQLAKPRSRGPEKAMWLYDTDSQISYNAVRQATGELAVLKGLFIDKFLLGQRDFKYVLLGELLFPESVQGAAMSDEIKRAAMQNQFRVSQSRIDDFFGQSRGRSELFWLLLKAEAQKAGCATSPKQAGDILKMIVERMTEGKVDAATLVKNAGAAHQMTEDDCLQAFADVLTIVSYARIATEVEDVTESEMAAAAAIPQEKFSAEFVEFNAKTFADKAAEPGEQQTAEQFNKYKNYLPGVITQDNPFGFGYKQRARVAVEYMLVKLDDVKKLVAVPTEEEAEEFYQQNLERFVEEIPADANDPNAQPTQRQKSYAEVASLIKDALLNRKVSAKATSILGQATEIADSEIISLDFEKARVEDFKAKAKDYSAASESVAKQNNIKIYAGKTGLLSAEDFQLSQSLGSLMMQSQSRIPTRLTKIAFALDQLGDEAAKLGPYEPAKPKMFVSVGPLLDNMGSFMAMIRVIDAVKAAVPPDVNFSYERNLPQVTENVQISEITYSLKEQVRKDCKNLAAFAIANQKAEDFMAMVKADGWEKAIKKFNADYPAKVADSNTFDMQKWTDKTRVSRSDMEMAKVAMSGSPAAERYINQSIMYGKLIDAFYSQFTGDSTEAANLPLMIKFQPQMSCFAVKSLNRTFAPMESYETNRQQIAYGKDYIIGQSMAFEFFMPDNITKRMNLRPAQKDDKSDSNSVAAPGDDE